MSEIADLLVAGGRIVDGTGAPARGGSVAILDGVVHIVEPGDAVPKARRTIDAAGLVVAPGFIDLHSHGGLVILADPRHEPKVRQGVTTEIIGRGRQRLRAVRAARGPGRVRRAQRGPRRATGDRLRLGLGSVLPRPLRPWPGGEHRHPRRQQRAAHRRHRLGRRAPRRRARSRSMRAALREAMEEGAFGVSIGPRLPARSPSPRPTSWRSSPPRRRGRRLLPHPRALPARRPLPRPVPGGDRDRPARRGRPSHITHFYHRATYPGPPEQMLALVDDARAEGLDVTFDSYPYEWASHAAADPAAAVGPGRRSGAAQGAARGPGGPRPPPRRAARRAARPTPAPRGWADMRLGAFTRPENLRWEARTLAEVMRETAATRSTRICDLLLAEDLGVTQVTTGPWTDGDPPLPAPPGRRWSAPTRPSSARSRRRAPTARSRASSASSCATSGSCPWRRRCAR